MPTNKISKEIIMQEKRRVWAINYARWFAEDPYFDQKHELCYSYVFNGKPAGWFLKKKKKERYTRN